jgi:hypothetical protein
MIRRNALRLVVIVAAVALFFAARWYWGVAWQRVTISLETTRVLGPLNPDGTVDFLAAMNAHYAQGVTRDNNAAVPLLLLSNRNAVWPNLVEGIARSLDAPELLRPRSANDCYMSLDQVCRRIALAPPVVDESYMLMEERELAQEPWLVRDHLDAATWLMCNANVMRGVEEAVRRPRYFIPMAKRSDRSLFGQIPLMPAGLQRPFERAFAARAMYWMAQGDLAAAHRDAVTLFRLGLLLGQQPTLMERIVSLAIINKGLDIDGRILAVGADPALAAGIRHDLDMLADLPSMAEPLDIAERLGSLDNVMLFARFGPDGPGDIIPPTPTVRTGSFTFGMWPIHFDPVLREANSRWDRLIQVAAIPEFARRESQISQMAIEAREYQAALEGQVSALARIANPRIVDFIGVFRQRDYTREQIALTRAGLDAVILFSRKGESPASRREWLNGIPPDLFAGRPIRAEFLDDSVTLACDGPPPLVLSEELRMLLGKNPPRHDFQVKIRIAPAAAARSSRTAGYNAH